MRPLRILFAVHGYKPAYRIGGPIVSVSSLAERLVQLGHEVTVVTTNSNLDEDLQVSLKTPVDVNGVRVYYFQHRSIVKSFFPWLPYFRKSLGYLYCPGMSRFIKSIISEIDIVHTHLPFIYPSYIAARIAIRHSKPLFYHQRGVFDPERLKFRSIKKLLYINLIEIPIMRKAEVVFALTVSEMDSYRKLSINTNCAVIPNGIDLPISGNKICPDAFQQKYKYISSSTKLILFLGRIHPIKGAESLIEAFISIKDKIMDSVLVLAGPDEWRLQDQYVSRVKDAGLSHRIIFPGVVVGDEKQFLLSRANLFCLPSVAEGFSMAILEALANKTPVLISPGCHFSEVEEAGAGKVCHPDQHSLAQGLTELLKDDKKLKMMGENGFKLVAERYDWNSITKRIIDCYLSGRDGT